MCVEGVGRVAREHRGLYRASEFAALTGVTVRALHHYDRVGLLKPTGRSAAGYRLYGAGDFARLQQVLTLKFIGLPLRQIKEVRLRLPSAFCLLFLTAPTG